ncbi:ABC transporter ATP-binding protein [Ilumatobacter sp.]|uniref:ABC transporter ATP-binding protein n=1 Tax=Ilumatobacter sp. TaxID=1967498 RepID=UPI003B521802
MTAPPAPTGPPSGPKLPPPAPLAPPAAGAVPPSGMIAVDGASKWFGSVVAVSDVTFAIDDGVTALLGPNGAGKSTLFRMLCGLTAPSRGTLRVLGADPRRDREVRGSIGLVPQQDALFDHLEAAGFVEIAARTHGVSPGDAGDVARWALEQVDLADVASKELGAFSKGMRQRVKVAAALVNDPRVLILDEPLTGLDPVQRRRMIELFHRLGDAGRCVLVSSHVLDEVARLGSQVLVVAQGRLVARGDYRDLRELMDDRPHRIRLATSDPRRVASTLVERGLVTGVDLADEHVVVDTLDVDALGRELAPIAVDLGARLTEVAPLDDDLESVFRYLVEGR